MDREGRRNILLLTASALLTELIGLGLRSWLAGRIGADGLGLVQLCMSVEGLAATLAISGLRFGTTRLVAEELGLGRTGQVTAAVGCCLSYAALFGLAAGLGLWLLSDLAAARWIGEAGCARALRFSAISMPCIALSSALSGYFTAVGRLGKPALVHLIEQLAGVGLVMAHLSAYRGFEPGQCCAAVSRGRAEADLLSLGLMLLAFWQDSRRYPPDPSAAPDLDERLLGISLPLALAAYARSGLSTARQLLTPRGLEAAGDSARQALAGYGSIQGMILPLLLFPAMIPGAAAELAVPVLTGAQVRGEKEAIRKTAGALTRRSLAYSLAVSAVLFFLSGPLAERLFHRPDLARWIRLLVPLVPVMYLDTAVDGCLKGLGRQRESMGINVLDGLLGLGLCVWLLPRYGLRAYVGGFYLTELSNLALSLGCLFTALPASPAGAARRSPARPEQTG